MVSGVRIQLPSASVLTPLMKLHKIKKANRRISNDEGRRMESLREIFLKQTEYIHLTFDVRRSSVYFSIKLAAFQANGGAYKKHCQ
jgi:hypothetical protein